jgi:hypothetical protein
MVRKTRGRHLRGMRCMRVSMSSWRTAADDVERAVAAAELSLTPPSAAP